MNDHDRDILIRLDEAVPRIEDTMKEFIKHSEKRFASKTSEYITYGLVVMILTFVVNNILDSTKNNGTALAPSVTPSSPTPAPANVNEPTTFVHIYPANVNKTPTPSPTPPPPATANSGVLGILGL